MGRSTCPVEWIHHPQHHETWERSLHPAAPAGAAAPPADAPGWSARGLGRNPRARPSRPRRHAAALARVAWGDAGMLDDAQAVPAPLGVQMQEALATSLLRHGRSYDV